MTWNLGNLQNGEQEAAQNQVTVIIRGKTTITNTATVGSSTPTQEITVHRLQRPCSPAGRNS